MTNPPATDWLFLCSGIAVGLAGLLVLWRALLRDRARGSRRCPRCWYDMSHTPGLTCSECGRSAKRERKLFKTHRRWRWVPVAILLLISARGIARWPAIRERGPVAALPTTALILYLPYSDDGASTEPLLDELHHRQRLEGIDSMWGWQWQLLVKICLPHEQVTIDSAPIPIKSFPLRDPLRFSPYLPDLLCTAIECGAMERFGLANDVAEAFPVEIAIEPTTGPRPGELIFWTMAATPTFPLLRYRATATPRLAGSSPEDRPDWLPEKIELMDTQSGGFAAGRTGLPTDLDRVQVIFDVGITYAPASMYGSYGPEEFTHYATKQIIVELDLTEQ